MYRTGTEYADIDDEEDTIGVIGGAMRTLLAARVVQSIPVIDLGELPLAA